MPRRTPLQFLKDILSKKGITVLIAPETPKLDSELLARAIEVQMSEEEKEKQRISFAYGNCAIENPDITKEDVARAARKSKK